MKRNSKSIEPTGTYRVKTRAVLYFTKALAFFVLFVVAFSFLFSEAIANDFFQLLIVMNPEAIKQPVFQLAATLTLSWYLFETIILLQYNKVLWTIVLHHIVTVLVATLVLVEVYIPIGIIYGICMVSCVFPIEFLIGFRIEYGKKYPEWTRKTHQVAYYYLMFLVVVCVVGVGWTLYNGYIKDVHSISYIVFSTLSCFAWGYDDWVWAKSIWKGSQYNYEDFNFEACVLMD